MKMPAEKLGARFDGGREVIDGERARAYAAATNDTNPLYASGTCVPPVFGVVPTWRAMVLAMDGVIPPEARERVVHGERDMHFHRPLAPGMSIRSTSEAFCWRVGKSNTRYTIRIESHDEAGQLVLEQHVTMFIHGMSEGESLGPDKPDHAFPEEARARRVGEHGQRVDADQTYRYRDASGDDMAIHVDENAARRAGLPGIILHGMCTMAMVGHSVVGMVGDGDPRKLRRLALRWSKFVLPGTDLATAVYDAGEQSGRRIYAFEASSQGALVVTQGRAELGEPGSA